MMSESEALLVPAVQFLLSAITFNASNQLEEKTASVSDDVDDKALPDEFR